MDERWRRDSKDEINWVFKVSETGRWKGTRARWESRSTHGVFQLWLGYNFFETFKSFGVR